MQHQVAHAYKLLPMKRRYRREKSLRFVCFQMLNLSGPQKLANHLIFRAAGFTFRKCYIKEHIILNTLYLSKMFSLFQKCSGTAQIARLMMLSLPEAYFFKFQNCST